MKVATCAEVEPLLPVFVDGELAAEQRVTVEAHLAECATCRDAREEFRSVGNVLRRHFAGHAESEIVLGVLQELEGEATEALIPPPVRGASSIDEIQRRLKASRTPHGPVPAERAEAETNVTPRPASADGPRYLVGQVLGGYRIDGEIARGGMGVVYRATQLSMDRPVALKVLSSRLAEDETFKKRFIREARAAATIDHPNIIKVYDAGEDRNETFFAMEFVPGDDAETVVLDKGPLEPRRAAGVALEVARALEAAHARGIVHRDVKPANVLLPDHGGVKLADLGLAKLEDGQAGEASLTIRRTVMGSPNYMPPEQAQDARDTDARSDVYSLGATLYHMVVGERPWGAGASVDIMSRVLSPQPLAIPEQSSAAKPLDPGIRAIMTRACAKDRAQRYATMAAFREDLEAYLAGAPLAALSTTTSKRASRHRSSGKLPALTGTRRRPATDSQRRVAEAGSSPRRAVAERPKPASSRVVVIVGAFVALAAAAVLVKRTAAPEPAPDVASDDPWRRHDPAPSPARSSPEHPAAVNSRAPAGGASEEEASRAYDDLVKETDRLQKLDRWGDALALLDAFAKDRPRTAAALRARREGDELRGRIGTRLQQTLADADARASRGDWEGAEDALDSVDAWGDAPAKAKAQDAIAALRVRAAKAVPAPGPQEKPPADKPDASTSASPAPSPAASPSPSPAAPAAAPSPVPPLEASEIAALAPLVNGKLDALPGNRVRLAYDFQTAAQADDWVPAPLEPAWVREAFEPLPCAAVPSPYDQQAAWSAARGAFLGTGWRRRRTNVVFAGQPLRIDLTARLLSGRNLAVSCGDPAHPYIVGLGLSLADAPFPKAQGRSKDEQAALAQIQKLWRELAHPSLVVARERGAFDWVLTSPLVPFAPSAKGTHLVIELVRDEDGDAIVVGCDAQRSRVALGKDALGAGPVGLEVLGRPVVFEAISIVGVLDPVWGRATLHSGR